MDQFFWKFADETGCYCSLQAVRCTHNVYFRSLFTYKIQIILSPKSLNDACYSEIFDVAFGSILRFLLLLGRCQQAHDGKKKIEGFWHVIRLLNVVINFDNFWRKYNLLSKQCALFCALDSKAFQWNHRYYDQRGVI